MTKKPLALLIFVALLTAPAWAVPREIIALQQQVALLMAEMQDLQKSVTANAAVLKTLVGQNADAISAVQTALKSVQQSVSAQAANNGQNQTQIGQEFQNLSDAIGELQARVNKMNEIVAQIQQAQQTLPAPTGQTPAAPGAAAPNSATPGQAQPAASGTPSNAPPVLPAAQLYQNALTDYVNGSYPLAEGEFRQFVHAYPSDDHTAEANYYLGDILMKEQKYGDAIKSFDAVLNQFPDGKIAPGAQLKKGFALIALKERAAGIRELRSLISHYPRTHEARQAHDELSALGVSTRVE